MESYDQTPNEAVVEESFKLGQRDFDETELDREQEEQHNLVKERHSSEVVSGLDARSSEDEEDSVQLDQQDEWRNQSKHVFILSESGKPIYSL